MSPFLIGKTYKSETTWCVWDTSGNGPLSPYFNPWNVDWNKQVESGLFILVIMSFQSWRTGMVFPFMIWDSATNSLCPYPRITHLQIEELDQNPEVTYSGMFCDSLTKWREKKKVVEGEGRLCLCLGGSEQSRGHLGMIWSIHLHGYTPSKLPAQHHPQTTNKDGNTGHWPHPTQATHTACLPGAGRWTNVYSSLGSQLFLVALNSLNGAVITRYLLVSLLGLFYSLWQQAAWIGLGLTQFSSFSPSQSLLIFFPSILPKLDIQLTLMVAGVLGLTDKPNSPANIC